MQDLKPIVFLVADDAAVLGSLTRALGLYRHDVKSFSSAQAFLDTYKGQHGCLVLDLSMPDINGLKLQELLLENDIFLPVIFISGHGGVPESVQAIKAGAIDFLQKPFLTEVLLQRIDEAIKADYNERSSMQHKNAVQLRFASLTGREKDVYDILVASEELPSSKEIARQLGISHRTVEHHRSRILEKTQTRTIVELQLLAKEFAMQI